MTEEFPVINHVYAIKLANGKWHGGSRWNAAKDFKGAKIYSSFRSARIAQGCHSKQMVDSVIHEYKLVEIPRGS